MANEQNLIKRELSSEEASRMGKLGAKKSAETKRQRRAMRETLGVLLKMPLKKGDVKELDEVIAIAELKGANLTVQDAIMLKQTQKAMKGDQRAVEFIRDTIGEKPTDRIEMTQDISETALEIKGYIDEYKKRDAGTPNP